MADSWHADSARWWRARAEGLEAERAELALRLRREQVRARASLDALAVVASSTHDTAAVIAAARLARAFVRRGLECPRARALLAAARSLVFIRELEADPLASRLSHVARWETFGRVEGARADVLDWHRRNLRARVYRWPRCGEPVP